MKILAEKPFWSNKDVFYWEKKINFLKQNTSFCCLWRYKVSLMAACVAKISIFFLTFTVRHYRKPT